MIMLWDIFSPIHGQSKIKLIAILFGVYFQSNLSKMKSDEKKETYVKDELLNFLVKI